MQRIHLHCAISHQQPFRNFAPRHSLIFKPPFQEGVFETFRPFSSVIFMFYLEYLNPSCYFAHMLLRNPCPFGLGGSALWRGSITHAPFLAQVFQRRFIFLKMVFLKSPPVASIPHIWRNDMQGQGKFTHKIEWTDF